MEVQKLIFFFVSLFVLNKSKQEYYYMVWQLKKYAWFGINENMLQTFAAI